MQTDGKLVQHIIMGLGDLDGVNEAGVRVLADMVAKYFLQRGYQVFWGSHYSSDNADWAYRHVHFAVNTVNIITGKRLPISDSDLGALCAFMRSYWPQCNWRAERKKSFFVDYSKEVYRSKEHPYMIADVDRLIVGEDAGLECKTASAFNADQWKDGAVPRHYLLQCYHYMAVTGKRKWYIAVVVLGQGFQYAKLEWDEKVISDLIAVEGDFWFNHVIPNAMPAADGSNATDQVLDQLYGSKTMPAVIRLDGFEKRLARRNEIGEQLKLLEQEQKQIDQEVKMYMGSHETAICEGFKVSWQSVTSSRLDTKRIKVEQPELYREYLTESTSRKFTVKAA